MLGKIKIAALSALVAMGSLAALPSTASAGKIDVEVYLGGGYGPEYGGYRGDYYDRYENTYDGDYRGGGYGYGRKCSPWKAEEKARAMGLRGTFVADVDYDRIIVKGRKWGERRTVVFARNPSCAILSSR